MHTMMRRSSPDFSPIRLIILSLMLDEDFGRGVYGQEVTNGETSVLSVFEQS